MSLCLRSFKRDCIGDYIKGDTRRLDYSSYIYGIGCFDMLLVIT